MKRVCFTIFVCFVISRVYAMEKQGEQERSFNASPLVVYDKDNEQTRYISLKKLATYIGYPRARSLYKTKKSYDLRVAHLAMINIIQNQYSDIVSCIAPYAGYSYIQHAYAQSYRLYKTTPGELVGDEQCLSLKNEVLGLDVSVLLKKADLLTERTDLTIVYKSISKTFKLSDANEAVKDVNLIVHPLAPIIISAESSGVIKMWSCNGELLHTLYFGEKEAKHQPMYSKTIMESDEEGDVLAVDFGTGIKKIWKSTAKKCEKNEICLTQAYFFEKFFEKNT